MLGIGPSVTKSSVILRFKGGVIPGPTNTVAPVVSGTAKVGSTLSVTDGTWTGNGTITYAYQWLRNGSNIASATANTYTLVSADDLTTVSCRVTATDLDGSRSATSNGLAITEVAPVNTVAPAVTGTTAIGDTLTCGTGTWTGSNITYSYQWQRDGVDISGATASTYLLVLADDARSIRCVVTATNSGGAVSADSNAVTAGVVAFTPADLFGVGDLGGFWDLSESSTLWQDTSGTTAVTAAGQNLSRIDDLSGNGNNWLLTTGQPLYQEDGLIPYMSLDGVDDAMATGTITGLLRRQTTIAIAMRYGTGGVSAAYNFVIAGQNGANDYIGPGIRVDSVQRKQARSRLLTNARAIVANPTDASNGATPPDTYFTINMTMGAADQNIARDGTFLTATSHAWQASDAVNGVINTGVAASGVERRIVAAFYITRDLTSGELADLHAWMDAKLNP